MNQVIEAYLRYFTNYQQDNWVQWLSLAQFAYNNSVNLVMGVILFFANYGKEMQTIRTELNQQY